MATAEEIALGNRIRELITAALADGGAWEGGGGGGAATQLDADGTVLDVNAIVDGEILKRVGATIVSVAAGAPGAHAATHQNGGGDEITVAGLSGELADQQEAKPHVLATVAALGDRHTVSGLTARQVLIATGAAAALFRALVEADIPAAFMTDTEVVDALIPVYDEIDSVDTTARGRLKWRGEWSIVTLYDANDAVRYFDDFYAANTATTGGDPGSEVDWDLLVRGMPLPLSVDFGTEVHSKPFSALDDVSPTWDADVVQGAVAVWDDANSEWIPVDYYSLVDEVLAISPLQSMNDVSYGGGIATNNILVRSAGGLWVPVDPLTLFAALAHAARHQNGGADEISIAGLSGVAGDPQIADTIRTTSGGGTNLPVGAVADGQFLKRVGATVVGGAPGGGGSADIEQIEVDFGTRAVKEKKFSIADATVAAGMLVMAGQSYEAATGLQADENEFASLHCVAGNVVDSVGYDLFIRSNNDQRELQGKFMLNILKG